MAGASSKFERAPREVAIVSVAQSDHQRAIIDRNEVELIQPVIQQALEQVGVQKGDIDFTCSGSSDYLAGQAFSFVMTLDAVGAWPPIHESPRRDGRRLGAVRGVGEDPGRRRRHGARSTATASRSPGDLPLRAQPRSSTRTTSPAVARRRQRSPACRPGAARRRHGPPRPTWPRSPSAAARRRSHQPARPAARVRVGRGAARRRLRVRPAAPHDCAPITDGGVAVVLAAGDRGPQLGRAPGLDPGIDHRIERHNLGCPRPDRARATRDRRREKAGVGDGKRRRRRAARTVHATRS